MYMSYDEYTTKRDVKFYGLISHTSSEWWVKAPDGVNAVFARTD